MSGIVVKIYATGGADSRLYGAVTSKEISEELEKQHGIVVDKRKIVLEDPIKAYGSYTLDAKLYPEISGKINVIVTQKD